MENKKIFISGIDTKLGFHVVEYFRDDHLELENYSYLVGSSQSTGHDKNINTAVHAIINVISFLSLVPKGACAAGQMRA